MTTETEVLFHKTFRLCSSETVHPNILRKMLTDIILKSCTYSDWHGCKHCHKKAAHWCKPQAVEELLHVSQGSYAVRLYPCASVYQQAFLGQILLTLFTSLAVPLFDEGVPESIASGSCLSELFCK